MRLRSLEPTRETDPTIQPMRKERRSSLGSGEGNLRATKEEDLDQQRWEPERGVQCDSTAAKQQECAQGTGNCLTGSPCPSPAGSQRQRLLGWAQAHPGQKEC